MTLSVGRKLAGNNGLLRQGEMGIDLKERPVNQSLERWRKGHSKISVTFVKFSADDFHSLLFAQREQLREVPRGNRDEQRRHRGFPSGILFLSRFF